ncbi:MAG: hypothetical protein R3275_04430 [Saprospiraceae bacterium]|nr:hypothetical protein [Saprospiraceae bacterium]
MLVRILKIGGLIAIIALVVLVLQTWHEVHTFDNMVEESFQEFRLPAPGASDIPEPHRAAGTVLEAGDREFSNGDYDAAIEKYRLLQHQHEGIDKMVEVAEFHECLALLHQNGINAPAFRRLLDHIRNDPEHRFVREAQKLHAQMQNILVRLYKG